MGLGVRWILSFCLIVVPIAITLGILFPVQNHYRATGGKGSVLGGGGYTGGGSNVPGTPGAGKPPKKNDGINWVKSCDQFAGLGGKDQNWEEYVYTLNPNQWGLKKGDESGMCMNVAFHNNGTYGQADSQNSAQKNRAPEFQVTWKYPQAAAGTNNVHAFPNIKLDSVFPETFGNINKLYVDFEWKYILGNDNTSASAVDTLEANNVATNVAIDMFGDKDKKTSADNVNAAYEIMVWFAHFSPSAQVIGQAKGVQHTIKIADEKSNTDVLFDLFEDKHPTTSQYVMTWRAQETTEKFHGDLYPLVEYLFSSNDANHPTKADYLGSFGMGSEAYDSPQNVTFYVPDFAVNVETSGSS